MLMKQTADIYSAYYMAVWNRVLFEKLIVVQIVKKFPAFCGTQRLIKVLTRAHHWSLS